MPENQSTQVKNEEVYRSAKSLVVAVMELINCKIMEGMKIPYEIKQKYKVNNDNSCSFTYEPIISVWQLLFRMETEIHALPEYNKYVDAMRVDVEMSKHIDTLVGTWSSRCRFTAGQYIDSLLQKQILAWVERRGFDKTTFDNDYLALESFFYTQTIEMVSMSFLQNFVSEVPLVQLPPGLRIRELNLEERGNLVSETNAFPFSRHVVPLGTKYVIELEYSTKKVFGEGNPEQMPQPEVDAIDKINKVLIALRLFKTGAVKNSFIITRYKSYVPIGGTTFSGSFSDVPAFGNTYTLKASELAEFSKFWEKIENSSMNTVALRRFSYSYGRENVEDKLIDLMIALEALFLQGEKAGASSGLIISIACSALIGKTKVEREQIRKRIDSAYNLRNKIVHGIEFNRFKKDKNTGANIDILQETATEIESYLRESLKRMQD
jgi:hypothetical protein